MVHPTVDDLEKRLMDSGWRVTATIQAPALLLTSDGPGARRYALDKGDIARICDIMARAFGGSNRVFKLTPSGFNASLRYRIYTCVTIMH